MISNFISYPDFVGCHEALKSIFFAFRITSQDDTKVLFLVRWLGLEFTSALASLFNHFLVAGFEWNSMQIIRNIWKLIRRRRKTLFM